LGPGLGSYCFEQETRDAWLLLMLISWERTSSEKRKEKKVDFASAEAVLVGVTMSSYVKEMPSPWLVPLY
jgi:hypothetical protein